MRKHRVDFAVVFILSVIMIALSGVLLCSMVNERNRITSGVVVDKQFHPSYSYADVNRGGQGNSWYYYDQRSDRYSICIEGVKDGKPVRYWFDVPGEEYNKYHVGDFFSK